MTCPTVVSCLASGARTRAFLYNADVRQVRNCRPIVNCSFRFWWKRRSMTVIWFVWFVLERWQQWQQFARWRVGLHTTGCATMSARHPWDYCCILVNSMPSSLTLSTISFIHWVQLTTLGLCRFVLKDECDAPASRQSDHPHHHHWWHLPAMNHMRSVSVDEGSEGIGEFDPYWKRLLASRRVLEVQEPQPSEAD